MEVLIYFIAVKTKTKYILKIPQLKYTFIIFLIFIFTEVKSQDPNYSQFTHNPIYYNPAYTGISSGMTMRFNYRKQWANLPVDFKSYNFNIDLAARTTSGSGGIGLMVDKNTKGFGLEETRVGLPISVRVPLYENLLVQMGVMTSFVQKSLNWGNLVFGDQLDPRFGNVYPSDFVPPINNKVTYPDFDIGLAFRLVESTWSGKQIIATAGVAVHHVFAPNESFYDSDPARLPRKLVITGDFILQNEDYEKVITSYNRGNKGGFKFNPGFIFQKQAVSQYFAIGMNVYKSNIYTGLWYRNENTELLKSSSLILMLGINAKINEESRLKILYSYDVLLNESLNRAAGGTHEITLIFTLDSFSALTGGSRGGTFGRNMMGSRSNRYSAMECSPF